MHACRCHSQAAGNASILHVCAFHICSSDAPVSWFSMKVTALEGHMPMRPGGRPCPSTSRQYSPRPMASCRIPAHPKCPSQIEILAGCNLNCACCKVHFPFACSLRPHFSAAVYFVECKLSVDDVDVQESLCWLFTTTKPWVFN